MWEPTGVLRTGALVKKLHTNIAGAASDEDLAKNNQRGEREARASRRQTLSEEGAMVGRGKGAGLAGSVF